MSAAPEITTRVRWRKIVLLDRAVLVPAWHRLFPLHDLGTARLRRRHLDGEQIERLAHERGKQRSGQLPENWGELSLDQLLGHFNTHRSTPQVTVEAIMLAVRERGIAALNEPKNIERLRRCDETALAEINRRISRLEGERRG
jgi:hypothetical protein